MSEGEVTPYRKWLDEHMIVTDDRLAVACKEHGEICRWEDIDHPPMAKMEMLTIFHMAAEHGEDYDRIQPAD